MKSIYRITIIVVLVILVGPNVFAQGSPPATPIDGGLSLLLAAGGAYGIKRFMGKSTK